MAIVNQYCNDNKYFLHIREVFLTEILSFFISEGLRREIQPASDKRRLH